MRSIILFLFLIVCSSSVFGETKPVKRGATFQEKTIVIKDDENNNIYMKFVWITPNFIALQSLPFPMGAAVSEQDLTQALEDGLVEKDEVPAHPVAITKGFWMSKYELTQQEWEAVMIYNPSSQKANRLPVHNISWIETSVFLRRLNRKGIGKFRLPTEAEWEYTAYIGGIRPEQKDFPEFAWFDENSDSRIHYVGAKRPDVWGVHDMMGNVDEWTQDWYNSKYYQTSPSVDPVNIARTTNSKVYRGGNFSTSRDNCRITNRHSASSRQKSPSCGIRLVLETFE